MIAEKTGWTKHQILNDYSFSELKIMLDDAPKLKKSKGKKLSTDDEIASFFGTKIE